MDPAADTHELTGTAWANSLSGAGKLWKVLFLGQPANVKRDYDFLFCVVVKEIIHLRKMLKHWQCVDKYKKIINIGIHVLKYIKIV